MLQTTTLKFLKDLKKNNDKSWFDANRKSYESAKADFAGFIQNVIDKHSKKDESLGGMQARDCLFRINRDVRFSKDKSPYKTNMGAFLNPAGKKSPLAGYYFHCEPGQAFVGGGLWHPMPPDLKKVRQEIDYCFDEFTKIIGAKKFKAVYGDMYSGDDMRLSKVPQGFDKDSEAAEYLKLKSFIAMKKIDDAALLSKDLQKITVEALEALHPLLSFLNRPLLHD